jgi:S1-C subfamily serine protease
MHKFLRAVFFVVLAVGVVTPFMPITAVEAQEKGEKSAVKSDCKNPVPAKTKGTPQVVDPKYKNLPAKDDVPDYLQNISVTIRANGSEGSGVMTNVNGVNYVLTAAHVVSDLRKVRTVVGDSGSPRVVVEFDDAEVIKDDIEDGRAVGHMRYYAEVVRYSDAEHGEDLAILRVRKKNLMPYRVHFYLESKLPKLGTKLFHVGSLLGHGGSNSMTTGIMSQHGRVYKGVVYDQTTCAAFRGSSGGGVFLEDGRWVGMIVRGAGETFNLVVPMRRLHRWATKVGMDFTLDPKLLIPCDETLKAYPIEDNAKGGSHQQNRSEKSSFKFMIRKDTETKDKITIGDL